MSKKTVSIVGTAGIPAKYGGFETLAEHLVKNLQTYFKFSVYCSSITYSKKQKFYENARLIYLPIKANGKSSIFYDLLSLLHSCFNKSDVIIVLGVSGAFLLPFIKFFTSKKIIVNIDGLEWKRDKWGRLAKIYLKIQEKLGVKFSHYIVSDNLGIQQYVKKKYKKEGRLISYGGSHAKYFKLSESTRMKYNIEIKSYAFTVCRIEPENNIHLILEAFSQTKKKILFVGNWDSSSYGINLKKKYLGFSNISIIDPIYDQNKLNELRSNCNCYIHGHSAGGTNPSLVEAMWLGLPIIAYNVNYNIHTTDGKALYFNSKEELNLLLQELNIENKLKKIGNIMREIASKNYHWENISESYKNLICN